MERGGDAVRKQLRFGILQRDLSAEIHARPWLQLPFERVTMNVDNARQHQQPARIELRAMSVAPDRRDAARQALEICPGDFAIGFVGRFLEEKGVLDLVEASGLLKSGTRRSPVLVFMGQGPLEKQIRERCAQLGLKLRLLPARKNHEVAEIMNTLDVLVLPSQSRPSWKEQFGRVLTEAMACGVPVIGSDSGEIPNVIGDAGLIFHEGDRKALSRCLEVYCDNEVRRKAYSDCGQARVFSFFTNERVAERTLRIYERMSQ